MIIGGDFNLVMSPTREIDKSSLMFHRLKRLHPKPMLSVNELGPINSSSHGGSSTLQLKNSRFIPQLIKCIHVLITFFISAPTIPYGVESDILSITWSDHAPITLDLMLSQAYARSCHWHLNDHLLQSEVSRSILAKGLEDFFQVNMGSVSDFSTLWEAHKAVFCGAYIAESSRLKKDKNRAEAVVCPHGDETT